jgi:hypothetical protein
MRIAVALAHVGLGYVSLVLVGRLRLRPIASVCGGNPVQPDCHALGTTSAARMRLVER